MSESDLVLRRHDDGVATLTLNRPDQYNALSDELLAALQNRLDAISGDETVRAVVLAGSGKAFCAGHDLKQMRAHGDKAYFTSLFSACAKVMQTITALPQPVIAKVHGVAAAAGCQLVASCDLAVAAKQARFAVSGINVGLFCATPAIPLSRKVSPKRAFEMLVTGGFIDADTAADYGLINRAVELDDLEGSVRQLTDSICAKSTAIVARGKEFFYRQLEMPVDQAYEQACEVMACNMLNEDAAEGIDAFIEKRRPVWRDR